MRKLLAALSLVLLCLPDSSLAAPYAEIVIDAETSEVLQSTNADVRLHPAGLTKLMTIYEVFAAVRDDEVHLDDLLTVSASAVDEPPVNLGLRLGQEIQIRYLLRAAAVLGANDAATLLAEGVSGTEDAFALRLNHRSREMGLSSSSWKNAHGLTETGHFSSARDIANLFLLHKRDFPDFFNVFGRTTTDAGIKEVASSSRRIIEDVPGVIAARYGYTRAAGFSAAIYVTLPERSIVVVVCGGTSINNLLDRLASLVDRHT